MLNKTEKTAIKGIINLYKEKGFCKPSEFEISKFLDLLNKRDDVENFINSEWDK